MEDNQDNVKIGLLSLWLFGLAFQLGFTNYNNIGKIDVFCILKNLENFENHFISRFKNA